MYNRDFGGVRSDGQLNEFENNWKKQYSGGGSSENTNSQKTTAPQNIFPQKQHNPSNRRSEPQYFQASPPQDTYYSAPPVQETSATPPPASKGLFNFNLDFLRKIEMDDLILIAIGVLLLLDSDASNDMLIILIAFMLFF